MIGISLKLAWRLTGTDAAAEVTFGMGKLPWSDRELKNERYSVLSKSCAKPQEPSLKSQASRAKS
jgi:hypothetical protein